jgi:signal transduction histidine kinase
MAAKSPTQSRGLLVTELGIFIRLRWAAGCGVLAAAVLCHLRWDWFSWYGNAGPIALIGLLILSYNALLWLILARLRIRRHRSGLLALASAQLLLDLICLTALNILTGGIDSPLRGFFVFHMIFASLLLPRQMAYGGAGMAMVLLPLGLWMTGQWPQDSRQSAAMLAWVAMLLLTVWLTNGITRPLRVQRRRLISQNRRIRAMSDELLRQQKAMIQQEKMAVAGRMAAGVAHEIANPLASMDGLLQLMERRPEKLRPEAMKNLREQVARVSQILRRMTAFSHPGEGEWQTRTLNEIVEKAMDVIRFDPRCKRVQIDLSLARDLPPARILPEAIQQVLINLVVNALDAMENVDKPRLIVSTSLDGSCCVVEVIDNGPGILKEHRPHLFEPFFTTKPVGKGTGLGLSISYNIVETHGGKIDVISARGQGARFVVHLPLSGAKAKDATQVEGVAVQ